MPDLHAGHLAAVPRRGSAGAACFRSALSKPVPMPTQSEFRGEPAVTVPLSLELLLQLPYS